jgi:hypothetical protein
MSGTYWRDRHKNLRDAVALLFEEMTPYSMPVDSYGQALLHMDGLDHLGDGDPHDRRPDAPPRMLVAFCPVCEGRGDRPNPAWQDDDERQPEADDCDACQGVGFVRLCAPYKAPETSDDDMPF